MLSLVLLLRNKNILELVNRGSVESTYVTSVTNSPTGNSMHHKVYHYKQSRSSLNRVPVHFNGVSSPEATISCPYELCSLLTAMNHRLG